MIEPCIKITVYIQKYGIPFWVFRIFLFSAEKKGFAEFAPKHALRATAQIIKSRRIEELAHQDGCRRLLRERCAQRNIARSAKAFGFEARKE